MKVRRLNVIASVEAEVVMFNLAINTSTVHESESAASTEVETTEEQISLFLRNAKLVRQRSIFFALLMT